MQHAVFHTFAFLAFSCLAFSASPMKYRDEFNFVDCGNHGLCSSKSFARYVHCLSHFYVPDIQNVLCICHSQVDKVYECLRIVYAILRLIFKFTRSNENNVKSVLVYRRDVLLDCGFGAAS